MICTLKFIGVFYFEGCYRKLLPRTPPDLTRLRSARRSGALRVLPLRFSSRLRPRTRRRGILFHVELVECVPATWLWSEGVNVPSVWREVAEGNEERGESAVTSSPPPPGGDKWPPVPTGQRVAVRGGSSPELPLDVASDTTTRSQGNTDHLALLFSS